MSPVLFPASPVAGRRKTRHRLKGKQYCIISLVHYEHEHSHLSKDLSQLDVKIITPKTFFNGCEIKKKFSLSQFHSEEFEDDGEGVCS